MEGQDLPSKRETGNPVAEEKSRKDRTSSPSPPSLPSTTSSPSHEFSFTISLHPYSNSTPTNIMYSNTPPTFEIDLAPADDIFFHGHLLPLHLLSHPSVSPRPSDISMEELNHPIDGATTETKEGSKPKSFSSLFEFMKGQKRSSVGEKDENKKKNKKKKGFDVTQFLKKYARMVFFYKRQNEKRDMCQRPNSFSGNLREGWRKRRGELSMPASMRTSPTNSGLLSATPVAFPSSDESTMEELQNAIQAAIAHCKSSIEDKRTF